ncbi:hypothetical protein BDW62DRAFT_202982 [Aspergillus aurantiobrunneus]
MRDLLHHSPFDDEDEPSVPVLNGASANAAILGFRALAHSLHVCHPPVSQAVALFDVFKMNVSPLVRVFLSWRTHSSTLEAYRFAVEQAVARADLLNTQNSILIQATVLFLTALRNEDDSRTVWSLTSLVYHIAQAMGLSIAMAKRSACGPWKPSCEDDYGGTSAY